MNGTSTGNEDNEINGRLLQQEPVNDSRTFPKEKCVQPGGLKNHDDESDVVKGGVSSISTTCDNIGLEMLRRGGSAVDAGIAMIICLDVISPSATGIGGGGFMLVKSSDGDTNVIDFREVAPLASTEEMFNNNTNTTQSRGLMVAVPGQLRGLELAHQRYGKLEWKELFEPSIKLAREGFKMLNKDKKFYHLTNIREQMSEELRNLFKNESDVKLLTLADTLQKVADEGAQVFYYGVIAENTIKAITKKNGIMTLRDLQNYTAKIRPAVSTVYQDYHVFTAGPPAGGLSLLSALNILEGFDLRKENISQSLYYHYLVETMKFVFGQRTRFGDPDFQDMKNVTADLLNKSKASEIRKRIDKNRTYTDASRYGALYEILEDHGTNHVSVIDGEGGVVSITSSLEDPFGSRILTSDGIILNNQMGDFSVNKEDNFGLPPNKANKIAPGKRPLSSMTPVIALKKDDVCDTQISLGAAGGPRIISAVLQVLINMISFDLSIEDAILWPRLHHQLLPMTLEMKGKIVEKYMKEGRIDKNLIEFLKSKGNSVMLNSTSISIVNAVVKHGHNFTGFNDPRSETTKVSHHR